ncbi:hypothetical protein HY086_06625 [Candidatus Gottesmanbacteria bacterium]|nr:hypothetical protein [Candidatus Gottesmanbacteria bacterium]
MDVFNFVLKFFPKAAGIAIKPGSSWCSLFVHGLKFSLKEKALTIAPIFPFDYFYKYEMPLSKISSVQKESRGFLRPDIIRLKLFTGKELVLFFNVREERDRFFEQLQNRWKK